MKSKLIKLRLNPYISIKALDRAHSLADRCNNQLEPINRIYQHITNTSLIQPDGRPTTALIGAIHAIMAIGLHQIDLFISEAPEAKLNLIGHRISELVTLSHHHHYRYLTYKLPQTIHPQRDEWPLKLHHGILRYMTTFSPEAYPTMHHLHDYIDRLEVVRGRQVTGRRSPDKALLKFGLEVGSDAITDSLNTPSHISTEAFIEAIIDAVSTMHEIPLLNPHEINTRKTWMSRHVDLKKMREANARRIDPRKRQNNQ